MSMGLEIRHLVSMSFPRKKKIQNTLIHVLQGKFTFAYLCAWPTFANLILTCASDFRLEKFRFKFQIDKNLKTTFKS